MRLKDVSFKMAGIGVAVLLVFALLLVLVRSMPKNSSGTAASDSPAATAGRQGAARDGSRVDTPISSTFKDAEACRILTSSDVSSVIGDVEAAPTNGEGGIRTNGIAVSSCAYAHGTANVNDIRTVTLMVRAAVNHDGAVANENEFSIVRAAGGMAVDGFGDAAFWNQSKGQLDIKAGNNWYSITDSKGGRAGTGTLDVAKSVAERIKNEL